MAIDFDTIFSRGGKKLIALLDYSVRAVHTDLLFIFLVEEYRQLPSTPKAVALYEAFCTTQSPARLSITEILAPANIHLEVALRPLRASLTQVNMARASGAAVPPIFLPPKFLFDAMARSVRQKSAVLRKIRRDYRIRLSPFQNLPDGKMNPGQRYFVDKVWEPNLRPMLVSAGFRRVAAIA